MKKLPDKKNQHKNLQPNFPEALKNKYAEFVGVAIILLLGVIIYSNSFNCSFHFDDLVNIVNNKAIQNLSDVKTWWNYSPNRPVSMFTFALNYHFSQLEVHSYHYVNLFIHLINACLVWLLTLLIFSSPVMKDQPISKHRKSIAFFTSLLFVSHPLATQSVTYIIQRMTSLAAMFYLLSLVLYMKARMESNVKKTRYFYFAGSLISAILAVLTKENAYTLPLAILLLEVFFLQTRKLSSICKDRRVILTLIGFIIFFTVVLIKFSFSVFQPVPSGNGNNETITSSDYLLTQFSVIVKYVQLIILPINQNLDYNYPVSHHFFEIKTLLNFLILLSMLTLAILIFKRNRIISFGIFWFFLTLSVESSIIPINDVIYEHRTYIPLLGFFLILSSGLFMLFGRKNKYFAVSILLIIIGINSFLAYSRNKVWKDDITLWTDVISKSPKKARPFFGRANAFADQGQYDKAIADYNKAIRFDSMNAIAYVNRGLAYWKTGLTHKAFEDYSKAIEIKPEYFEIAYYNRGIAYGTFGQWEKAIDDYSVAIKINPAYDMAYSNRGVAFANLGQWEKAVTDYTIAIDINPDYITAYFNRGVAYQNSGQWAKAINDYSKVIEFDPNYEPAYYNRGLAYENLEQWAEALNDFSRCLELNPNNENALYMRDLVYKKSIISVK
ncbi:MAG: tetratricopeptide repeat protein [Bacteroidales bacterium]|nr:tetratricopeptide repeat protein [Bacteroidales bacterium]MDD4215142.1 tetratricopeptide repeat protein [Bacteroidales bacterium]